MRIFCMKRCFCQTQSSPAPTPRRAMTANTRAFRSFAANGRMAAGSKAERSCTSWACGLRTDQATAPVITSLSTDLKNCTRPSRLNSRLNPDNGETLSMSGFSRSVVQTKPCCTT